jgi:peptidylprolyl isomerase
MERRAKAKKRNTVVGAVVATVVVLAGVGIGAFALTNGSSSKKPAASTTPSATPTPTPTSTPLPAPKKCAKITPDPPAKGQPKIPQVTGKAPSKLVIHDVKVGHGRAAKDGDSLKVLYIGASCTTGKVFDASYLHPPTKPFAVTPLGKAQVIAGFNKGLVGIRPGGVRELVIPAKLAYQSNPSSAPTGPNDTLIFLVTAVSVKA